jgi:hypothetical protein
MTVPHAPQTLLSHHAIMELVGPFSRRGYRVDLPASDRGRGQVAFRPVDVPPGDGGRPALRSTLTLERVHRLKFRVLRTLEATDGLRATMTAEGDDLPALLDAVEEIDADRHFHLGPAGLIARSYRTELWRNAVRERGWWRRRPAWPRLTGAEARVGPLRLSAADTTGRVLDLRLYGQHGAALELTSDFLAVLGWSWRPLRRVDRATWVGSVRPSGGASERTARLEAELDAAVAHVAHTVAASPASFHRSHRGARWRAAFQRLLPLLGVVAAILAFGGAVFVLPKTPAMHMVMTHVSMLGVAAFWMMDRAYRLEVPAPPRPLRQARWSADPTPGGGG